MENFKCKVYTKAELATMYSPNAAVDTARKKLRDWIKKDKEFEQRLTKIGYTPANALLTPAQVRMIVERFGEP